MNLETEAQRVAESLPVGTTQRGICPACRGGDKGETSWIVGREADRVWFKCFRATCPGPASGVVGAANLAPAIAEERTRALARLRPYERPILPLSAEDWCYFRDRFGIDGNTEIGVTNSDEYVLPVRGWDGKLRGHVVRQPVWKGMPKAPRIGREGYWDVTDEAGAQVAGLSQWCKMPKTVLYPCSTQPMLAWYNSALVDFSHLVVVEDQISAIKVAENVTQCVALLGNGMNVEIVRDIIRTRPRVVTIALDPGAEGQAQNLAKKWGLYFEKTRVVMLEADPKDLPVNDLIEELGL